MADELRARLARYRNREPFVDRRGVSPLGRREESELVDMASASSPWKDAEGSLTSQAAEKMPA